MVSWHTGRYVRGRGVSRSTVSDSLRPHRPPASSVHEILQARILEWAAIPFSRGSPPPRDQTQVSGVAGRFFFFFLFLTDPPGEEKLTKIKEKSPVLDRALQAP